MKRDGIILEFFSDFAARLYSVMAGLAISHRCCLPEDPSSSATFMQPFPQRKFIDSKMAFPTDPICLCATSNGRLEKVSESTFIASVGTPFSSYQNDCRTIRFFGTERAMQKRLASLVFLRVIESLHHHKYMAAEAAQEGTCHDCGKIAFLVHGHCTRCAEIDRSRGEIETSEKRSGERTSMVLSRFRSKRIRPASKADTCGSFHLSFPFFSPSSSENITARMPSQQRCLPCFGRKLLRALLAAAKCKFPELRFPLFFEERGKNRFTLTGMLHNVYCKRMLIVVPECKKQLSFVRLRFSAKRLAGWRHFIQVGNLIPTSPFKPAEVETFSIGNGAISQQADMVDSIKVNSVIC